jgi:hypothetical protein
MIGAITLFFAAVSLIDPLIKQPKALKDVEM